MNEATAYCNGECPDGIPPSNDTDLDQPRRNLGESTDNDNGFWYTSYNDQNEISSYNLPFIPGKFNLDNMSLSLNATHTESN
jgi:hypothetical protein